jgi:hypothetical protein
MLKKLFNSIFSKPSRDYNDSYYYDYYYQSTDTSENIYRVVKTKSFEVPIANVLRTNEGISQFHSLHFLENEAQIKRKLGTPSKITKIDVTKEINLTKITYRNFVPNLNINISYYLLDDCFYFGLLESRNEFVDMPFSFHPILQAIEEKYQVKIRRIFEKNGMMNMFQAITVVDPENNMIIIERDSKLRLYYLSGSVYFYKIIYDIENGIEIEKENLKELRNNLLKKIV